MPITELQPTSQEQNCIFLYSRLSIDSWTGAQTTLFCAVDESQETVSGKYYENCQIQVPFGKLPVDEDLANKLWDVTYKLVKPFTKLDDG